MKLILALFLANSICGASGDDLAPAPSPAVSSVCLSCNVFERLYDGRDNAPAWTGWRRRKHFQALLEAVRDAGSHGLDPASYGLDLLEAANPRRSDRRLDEIATRAYLDLAHDLLRGRLDPQTVERGWSAPRRDLDLATYLASALENDRVPESLEALAPRDDGYARLRTALADYRAVNAKGAWPRIEPGAALHPGDRSPRVAQLRARLQATGEVFRLVPETERDLFDDEMAAAVLRLQERAHLDGDGVAGAETIEWLNVPSEHRVWQIAANLERLRWQGGSPEGRLLRVNIPDFVLEAWSGGEVEQRHRLIVGRRSRPTPVFSAQLAYFILNPWWETPHSLAVRDELPAFRRDPDMVQRLGFQVLDSEGNLVDPGEIDWNTVPASAFPYRLRQAPGPQNALGQVKFIFPNPYNTYLHDTPTRQLFEEDRRAFSSGCMRVDRPVDLARWVSEGLPDWPPERIDRVLAGGVETRVDLSEGIPVEVVYRTVVPEGSLGVRFLDDLYNRDGIIIDELEGAGSTVSE
ncbi:L,D-transpeptidase family protein [Maricaulis virginensis]|uniref:Murein L,D-transpeptidase n=1 Tax=Maricaulis virginensis TaxID=144022 RepID=A0A9W6MNY0_9PROT|nr:L,D-transpeptidase family protein [Maricaulis virginensis]GLK52406.1 murein L,D-transpeptidase [Maricaulis virginensis]